MQLVHKRKYIYIKKKSILQTITGLVNTNSTLRWTARWASSQLSGPLLPIPGLALRRGKRSKQRNSRPPKYVDVDPYGNGITSAPYVVNYAKRVSNKSSKSSKFRRFDSESKFSKCGNEVFLPALYCELN